MLQKLVRDAFKLAKEKIKEKGAAGAIIFIDEVSSQFIHTHTICMFAPARSATSSEFLRSCIVVGMQLDAIGTKRYDNGKSGDREVQRTMLELLNQLDGFTSTEKIKVDFFTHSYCSCIGNWNAVQIMRSG